MHNRLQKGERRREKGERAKGPHFSPLSSLLSLLFS